MQKSYSNYFGHIVFIGEPILKLFVVVSKTYGLQKDGMVIFFLTFLGDRLRTYKPSTTS